jgi:hypothetical protein
MKISEKQLCLLIDIAKTHVYRCDVTPDLRIKLARILDEITNQQSEELNEVD